MLEPYAGTVCWNRMLECSSQWSATRLRSNFSPVQSRWALRTIGEATNVMCFNSTYCHVLGVRCSVELGAAKQASSKACALSRIFLSVMCTLQRCRGAARHARSEACARRCVL